MNRYPPSMLTRCSEQTAHPARAASQASILTDGCGRVIDHLRLSLTERCNLACRYCVPETARTETQRISADLAVALVAWLSRRHWINYVRLTGGEPLLYPKITSLVERLAALGTVAEISLTTNGQTLAARARGLRDAGLARVNVSLDTLDPQRFARTTRGGKLARTLHGIETALDVGLVPVRINVLVQRRLNEDELPGLAIWGLVRGCTVRFLEVMPIGTLLHAAAGQLVTAAEIIERLSGRLALEPIPGPPGQPATDYAATAGGLRGVIGVIASTTQPFCSRCRRIRITSRGELLTCLFDAGGSDLLDAWNGQSLDEDRADTILQAAVLAKPALGGREQSRPMVAIGG